MAFDLSQYETVEERLEKWWKDNEDGSIQTELVNRPNASPDEFVFVARLYRTTADAIPVATGWASEIRTSSSFNKFACELAESSAIGRALANYIYSKKGARPSRIEMQRVQNNESNGEGMALNDKQFKPKYGAPGSKSAAMEMALHLVDSQSKNSSDVSVPVMWSVGESVAQIGEVVAVGFTCRHGDMIKKEGVAKATKKPYAGYVCSAPKEDQCDAKWAKLTAAGTWYWPDDSEQGKGGE
jgi:hypothetical protein